MVGDLHVIKFNHSYLFNLKSVIFPVYVINKKKNKVDDYIIRCDKSDFTLPTIYKAPTKVDESSTYYLMVVSKIG